MINSQGLGSGVVCVLEHGPLSLEETEFGSWGVRNSGFQVAQFLGFASKSQTLNPLLGERGAITLNKKLKP